LRERDKLKGLDVGEQTVRWNWKK